MSEKEQMKVRDYSFTKQDLTNLETVFSMSRAHAVAVAPKNKQLLLDLLNLEEDLREKIIKTFNPELVKELEEEIKASADLEKFKNAEQVSQ